MRRFLPLCLAVSLVLLPGGLRPCPAQETASPPRAVPLEPLPPLGLADLAPRAAELAVRGAKLRERVEQLRSLDAAEGDLTALGQRRDVVAPRFEALKAWHHYGFPQFAELRAAARAVTAGAQGLLDAIGRRLAEIEEARREWAAERARWLDLRSRFKEADLRQEAETIRDAKASIDEALALLAAADEPLLEFQRRAVILHSQAAASGAEIEVFVKELSGDLLRKTQPSLLSPEFREQLAGVRAEQLRTGFEGLVAALREAGPLALWASALPLVVGWVLLAGARRYRGLTQVPERWRFLVARPFSSGCLAVVWLLFPTLAGSVHVTGRLLLWTVGGLAAARLAAELFDHPWRRRMVYVLTGLALASPYLTILHVPLPLFRIYTAVVGLAGAALCQWRAVRNRPHGPWWYVHGLQLAGAVLLASGVAEAAGFSSLATLLLDGWVRTVFIVLFSFMAALLARGAFDFLARHPVLQRSPRARSYAELAQGRVAVVTDAAAAFVGLAGVLVTWRGYDTLGQALSGLLSLGFAAGHFRVTIGLVLAALVLMYGALATSWLVQRLLEAEVYPRRRLERGAVISVNRLVHYAFVLVGVLVTASTLGIDLKNFAVLAGALGVGIGFGLQNVVNNFVSGLILLFERPIKVGDVIEVGGQWGTVEELRLRSTVVQTFDNAEIIVPNAELVANRVTNWTFGSRTARVVLPVGIAYGSDVERAMDVLRRAGEDHPQVLREPAPQVFFMGFGASSLDLELRVWVADVDHRLPVRSDLHRDIDRRFREAGIEVPFSQHDLHLRTVDERARGALASAFRGDAASSASRGGQP